MKESVNVFSSVTGSLDPQTISETRPTFKYRNGNFILSGRKSEKLALHSAYQKFLQNGGTGPTILVRGISGSGKTTLVESLRQVVSESGGYFCSEKFFPNNAGGEPCE
jgi:Cdc6-like AAA superfamily ATPase